MKRLHLEQPSTNGQTGKDPKTGRFLPGNRLGRGNPHASATANLKSAFLEGISRDDMDAIVALLVAKSKGGNLHAAKIILDRLFGKPAQSLFVHQDLETPVESEVFL